MSKAEQG